MKTIHSHSKKEKKAEAELTMGRPSCACSRRTKLLKAQQAKTLHTWRDAVREIHERAKDHWHWALRRTLDAPRELVAALAAQTVGVPAALAAAWPGQTPQVGVVIDSNASESETGARESDEGSSDSPGSGSARWYAAGVST